jgi:hypothetical protein
VSREAECFGSSPGSGARWRVKPSMPAFDAELWQPCSGLELRPARDAALTMAPPPSRCCAAARVRRNGPLRLTARTRSQPAYLFFILFLNPPEHFAEADGGEDLSLCAPLTRVGLPQSARVAGCYALNLSQEESTRISNVRVPLLSAPIPPERGWTSDFGNASTTRVSSRQCNSRRFRPDLLWPKC